MLVKLTIGLLTLNFFRLTFERYRLDTVGDGEEEATDREIFCVSHPILPQYDEDLRIFGSNYPSFIESRKSSHQRNVFLIHQSNQSFRCVYVIRESITLWKFFDRKDGKNEWKCSSFFFTTCRRIFLKPRYVLYLDLHKLNLVKLYSLVIRRLEPLFTTFLSLFDCTSAGEKATIVKFGPGTKM